MTTDSENRLNIKNELIQSFDSGYFLTSVYQLKVFPDKSRKFTYISENIKQITGFSAEAIMENPDLLYRTTLPKYIPELIRLENDSTLHLKPMSYEMECDFGGGNIRWIELSSIPTLCEDGSIVWNGIQSDITLKKATEKRISKYAHELSILNKVNDVILECKNEQELFQKTCRCLVEEGGYALTWMALAPDCSVSGVVVPKAAYGRTEYVNEITIDLNDSEMQQGPTGTTLLKHTTSVANNFKTHPHFHPWNNTAAKYNLRASIVLPIYIPGKINGCLNLYSENQYAFDDKEVEILERIARNISLAIRSIRDRNEKISNKAALVERIKELRTTFRVQSLLQNTHVPVSELMQSIVMELPAGWQYVDHCIARIRIADKEYRSQHTGICKHIQEAEFNTDTQEKGIIEVAYTKDFPASDEGPFLKEERALINNLAALISSYFERRTMMQQLIESEARMSSILNNTSIGYVLLDESFRILSSNQKFCSKFSKELAIPCGSNELIFNDSNDFLRQLNNQLLSTYRQFKSLEFEYHLQQSDSDRYYLVQAQVIHARTEFFGFSLAFSDITEKKKLEIEKEKVTEELLKRNEALEQFAAIVSHNIRAPLTNILGLVPYLQSMDNESDKTEAVAAIQKSTQQLDQVLHDLNSILHLQNDHTKSFESMDVNAHLRDIVTKVKSDFNVMAKCRFHIQCPERFYTIISYFETIISHIIRNSFQFNIDKQNLVIELYAYYENGQLFIQIKDNGCGLDMQKYGSRLFGLYTRFHRDYAGKGIGLFMTKAYTELLGGSISAQSEINRGFTITISLPILRNADSVV